MLNARLFIFGLSLFILQTESLNYEKCKIPPPERHCIIESVVEHRWPHTKRYFFNWDSQKCILIRWANHCELPPPDVNNFGSELICRDVCSGWA
ncbi:unnamed protein product, partial [Iphiclides podalirius]